MADILLLAETNFDLSGLAFYTKKMRLPMHGGYKSVTSREVDGIVERLSACRMSCGRMHDYSKYVIIFGQIC